MRCIGPTRSRAGARGKAGGSTPSVPGGTQASTCCPLVRRSIGHKWKSVYVTNQSRRRKQRSRSQRRKIRRKEEGTGRVLPPPRWIAAAGDVLPPAQMSRTETGIRPSAMARTREPTWCGSRCHARPYRRSEPSRAAASRGKKKLPNLGSGFRLLVLLCRVPLSVQLGCRVNVFVPAAVLLAWLRGIPSVSCCHVR